MANEEIQIRFGGDLSSLSTAIRGMKSMVAEGARHVKDSFKEAFSELGGEFLGPLSIAGAIAEFERVSAKVEQIKRQAETLDVSPQFIQQIQSVGKLAGITGEEIEKAMNKFLIGLPAGSEVEEEFYRLADRIRDIPDPAERAREAVENFGKSGAKLIPILAGGSEGLKKMAEGFSTFSDAEIEAVEKGHEFIDKYESKLNKFFATAAYGWTKFFQIVKNLPIFDKTPTELHGKSGLEEALDRTNAQDYHEMFAQGSTEDSQKQAEKATAAKNESDKEYQKDLEAFDRYMQKRDEIEFKNKTPIQQLSILRLQEDQLWNDSMMLENESDMYDQLTAIEEVQGKILELKKKIGEQDKNEAKQAEDMHAKQLAALKSEAKARAEIAAFQKNGNAQFGTLQEVASSGFNVFRHNQWEWQQGPLTGMAREAMDLDARAHLERIWGNRTGAEHDEARSSEIKRYLEAAGAIAPTISEQIKSLNDKFSEAVSNLMLINEKASGSGLKVIGPTD